LDPDLDPDFEPPLPLFPSSSEFSDLGVHLTVVVDSSFLREALFSVAPFNFLVSPLDRTADLVVPSPDFDIDFEPSPDFDPDLDMDLDLAGTPRTRPVSAIGVSMTLSNSVQTYRESPTLL